MDVIGLLKKDHREVNEFFGQIEAASDRALKLKEKLFLKIQEALTVHTAAEEKILYPRMRELRDLRQNAFEAKEEHDLVKQLLEEISGLQVGDETWNAKVKVLIDLVRHHVREEETDYFKVLKADLKKDELNQLGEEIAAFKANFVAPPAAKEPRTAAEPSANQAAQ
jgi:hemerythrin superfamily protein